MQRELVPTNPERGQPHQQGLRGHRSCMASRPGAFTGARHPPNFSSAISNMEPPGHVIFNHGLPLSSFTGYHIEVSLSGPKGPSIQSKYFADPQQWNIICG